MKTVQEIQREIEILTIENLRKDADRRPAGLNSSIQFLRFCINYLKTNPRPAFIEAEIMRLAELLGRIEQGAKGYKGLQGMNAQDAEKHYHKIHNSAKLKTQLEILQFIYN